LLLLLPQTVTVPMQGREIPVIADTYVDREFGTGALKITPGHDVNDYAIGKTHSLPTINILNKVLLLISTTNQSDVCTLCMRQYSSNGA
jgi:valyl-tRNA synthetase